MSTLVPLDRIYPNPANIRRDLGDLTELANSLRAVGILQPLVVRPTPKGYLLVDGHRRYEAAILAGLNAVPCIATRANADTETELMLAASMHKALEPIEQADAFAALRKRGISPAQIAARTGYSVDHVQRRLLLATLPPEAKALVKDKTLTVGAATQLARETQRIGTGTTTARAPRPTYLNAGHPLAPQVRAACTHRKDRAVIGNTGCGQCWEHAITTAAVTP